MAADNAAATIRTAALQAQQAAAVLECSCHDIETGNMQLADTIVPVHAMTSFKAATCQTKGKREAEMSHQSCSLYHSKPCCVCVATPFIAGQHAMPKFTLCSHAVADIDAICQLPSTLTSNTVMQALLTRTAHIKPCMTLLYACTGDCVVASVMSFANARKPESLNKLYN